MYNVIVTRAKNEQGFLDNFINHYLNLGFDFIYIFIEKDQSYNIKNPKISFIKHSYEGNNVIPFMFNYFMKSSSIKNEIDWILHVDVDEFLFLQNNIKIHEYINKFYKENIGQFIFKWAMIENFRSIDSENDFQNIANQCKLYSNIHYKSMVKLKYLKHGNHPHYTETTKDTYLDNIKVKGKLKGRYEENNNYTNAILVHYHTRSLENVFVKALVTNITKKKISPKIIDQKYSIDKLKKEMKKLSIPFRHAKGNVLNKNEIVKIKFDTNTKIDNEIIHNMLKETCNSYNVDYNTVKNFIKNLELNYSRDFLC